MTILFKNEAVSFNQLKKTIGCSDGAIYPHIEKLVKAGYVEKKKELVGSTAQTIYKIKKEGRILFKEYLIFLENVLKEHQ